MGYDWDDDEEEWYEEEPTIDGVGFADSTCVGGNEKVSLPLIPCGNHRLRVKVWYKKKPVAYFDRLKAIVVENLGMPYGFTSRKGMNCRIEFVTADDDHYEYICDGKDPHEVWVEEKTPDGWVTQFVSGNMIKGE